MRSWDELSEVEQLQCIASDASKDARGFRNRDLPDTVGELTALIAQYSIEIGEQNRLDEERQQFDIARFEEMVNRFIENGAGDRQTAIRWIMQGAELDNLEHMCYHFNLPYSYFKEAA